MSDMALVFTTLGGIFGLLVAMVTLMSIQTRLLMTYMDARFDTVNHRLSALETDMTIVKKRLIGEDAVVQA